MSDKNLTDLTQFIRDVKRQIAESEDRKPDKGFWMGVSNVELEVEAITENKAGGGIAVYVLHGDVEKTKRKTQRIKIGLVTQDIPPPPQLKDYPQFKDFMAFMDYFFAQQKRP